jgi:hypothetical protein
VAVGLGVLFGASVSRAADPFEIQVYDGSANAPGTAALELHVNYVVRGSDTAVAPELPTDHVTHLTLEPSFGVTPWWELGAYLQGAIRPDGGFDYAGIKLRSKFVTPPAFDRHWRLGVNLEVSILPETYDADRWGGEIRPIAAWENQAWLFAVNPIVGIPLAGEGFSQGPTLEPAAMAVRKIGRVVSVGLEYYSSLGPIAHLASLSEEEQYIFEVLNLLAVPHLEVNAGLGAGLTHASNPLVFKTIVGYAFESGG